MYPISVIVVAFVVVIDHDLRDPRIPSRSSPPSVPARAHNLFVIAMSEFFVTYW